MNDNMLSEIELAVLCERVRQKENEYKISHFDELNNIIQRIPTNEDESYEMFYKRVMNLIDPYISKNQCVCESKTTCLT